MPTRTAQLLVRFTPEELALVKARARVSRTPLARYIRGAALGHAPRARDAAVYADAMRILNRVGLDLHTALAADPSTEGSAKLVLGELHEALHTLADVMRPARRRSGLDVATLE